MTGYLPEGYKDSTQETVDGPDGTVKHIEHWSGRIDAQVNAKSVGLKLTQSSGAPLEPRHVEAVAAHQKAVDQLRFARASGNPEWIAKCERRVAEMKARILETQ